MTMDVSSLCVVCGLKGFGPFSSVQLDMLCIGREADKKLLFLTIVQVNKYNETAFII